jgi:hypothetical protein
MDWNDSGSRPIAGYNDNNDEKLSFYLETQKMFTDKMVSWREYS